MTATGLCGVCGTRIDPAAGDVHPGCEPGIAADFAAADARRREARRLGEQGKQAALNRDPQLRAWALNHLRALAVRQEFVCADDIGDDFDAYGVPGEMRGGLWSTAKARGWVTDAGRVVSQRKATHGKEVNRYRSQLYRGRVSA